MQDHVSEILALDEELLTIGADILERMDILNDNINGFNPLTEAEYTKVTNHLRLEILDVDRFVKVNECKPISSPIFYSRNNIPSPDGLLSYDIFGTTQMERAGIFGYIDLGGYYLDPSCYKCWTRIDKAIKEIINKTKKYSIDRHGYFVEDPDGQTGIDFIRKNLDKIKFKSSESVKRDMRIQYLEKNRNRMFINKYLVIPPYYRDTNSGGKSVGVGGVNKLYQQLIIAVNSLKGTQEYGFDMSGPMMGRAIFSDEMPIIKNNNAILAFDGPQSLVPEETNCINCGRCHKACPFNLLPTALTEAMENKDAARLEQLKVMQCMECGSCAYVCPARRPLGFNNKLGKAILKEAQSK